MSKWRYAFLFQNGIVLWYILMPMFERSQNGRTNSVVPQHNYDSRAYHWQKAYMDDFAAHNILLRSIVSHLETMLATTSTLHTVPRHRSRLGTIILRPLLPLVRIAPTYLCRILRFIHLALIKVWCSTQDSLPSRRYLNFTLIRISQELYRLYTSPRSVALIKAQWPITRIYHLMYKNSANIQPVM